MDGNIEPMTSKYQTVFCKVNLIAGNFKEMHHMILIFCCSVKTNDSYNDLNDPYVCICPVFLL